MAPPVEISIPSTSIASPADSKPFTQYNITLRLPLRTYVVQKRYSDFTALHQTLLDLVGVPPPSPLPGKHWFKSTVSSPELTEDRRRALEAYLRSIAESPDRRWRDTPAWRAFLSLPGNASGSAASSSGIGIASRVPALNRDAANAAAARDPSTWLDLHREMKSSLDRARQQLAKRDADHSASGKQGAEAGAEAKAALIKASGLLRPLQAGLEDMKLGHGELLRRKNLLSAAQADLDGLEKVRVSMASARAGSAGTSREGTPTTGDKSMLLGRVGTGGSSRRVLGAPLPETERTRELDNSGVLQLQRQQMEEQDLDVEELRKVVMRQKEMGLAINDEVERQTEMLDNMNQNVDRVEGKVRAAKNKMRRM